MNFLNKTSARLSRLHTIPDVDSQRIPDNPATLGGARVPELLSQPAWNFGGANAGLPQPTVSLNSKCHCTNKKWRRGPLK